MTESKKPNVTFALAFAPITWALLGSKPTTPAMVFLENHVRLVKDNTILEERHSIFTLPVQLFSDIQDDKTFEQARQKVHEVIDERLNLIKYMVMEAEVVEAPPCEGGDSGCESRPSPQIKADYQELRENKERRTND